VLSLMTLIRTFADVVPALRQRIADLGLTHLDVDHRAGLSEGHTSKILCGMRKPSGETLTRLCAALGLALMPVPIDEENSGPTDDRALT
jgi:transcriptional regulator with XRE-family HTH domain